MQSRLLVLLASTLIAVAALAAEPVAKKGNVLSIGGTRTGAKTGDKLLTREQLRSCLAGQKKLDQQDAEVANTQAALDADKADIARLDADLAQQAHALQAERADVVTTEQAAVATYNAKLAQRGERGGQRNQKVDAYNAKLVPFNAQVQALNRSRQAWQTECADRPYDEADYFAIQRGK